jgi:hypothetical protein
MRRAPRCLRNKNLILLSVVLFILPTAAFATETEKISERIIGATFKALAKGFVATQDIQRIKQNNIKKIRNMPEEKFRLRYARVFSVVKDLPLDLRLKYNINAQMTKAQAVQNISSLDKPKVYKAIDSIPDKFITHQFRAYLVAKKQDIANSNVIQQIKKFWRGKVKKWSS